MFTVVDGKGYIFGQFFETTQDHPDEEEYITVSESNRRFRDWMNGQRIKFEECIDETIVDVGIKSSGGVLPPLTPGDKTSFEIAQQYWIALRNAREIGRTRAESMCHLYGFIQGEFQKSFPRGLLFKWGKSQEAYSGAELVLGALIDNPRHVMFGLDELERANGDIISFAYEKWPLLKLYEPFFIPSLNFPGSEDYQEYLGAPKKRRTELRKKPYFIEYTPTGLGESIREEAKRIGFETPRMFPALGMAVANYEQPSNFGLAYLFEHDETHFFHLKQK
jgi:hypothetical protein